jgi:hypothetical protein
MKNRTITLEHIVWLLLFLIGLGLRLGGLGAQSLTDREANLALQALGLARGQSVVLGPEAGYVLFTSLLFGMLGSSDFLARLLPALFGSGLVLMPLFYRKYLGRTAALIVALGLALDPGLVSSSQQAGGLLFAVFFVLLAIAFFLDAKIIPAGLACGAALVGSPSLWFGVLVLLVAGLLNFLISKIFVRARPVVFDEENGNVESELPVEQTEVLPFWKQVNFWVALGATVVFLGTRFFTLPTGLSASAAGLPAFWFGWAQPGTVPLLLVLTALLAYELLPLFLGFWGAVYGLVKSEPVDWILTLWAFVALVQVLFYPSRQVYDLVWLILPLWGLAGRQAVRLIGHIDLQEWQPVLGQTVLSIVLVIFVAMNVVYFAVPRPPENSVEAPLRAAAIVGGLSLLVLITLLIGWGWGKDIAISGSTLGLGAVMLVFMFTQTWNVTGLGRNPGFEIWNSGASDGWRLNRTEIMQTIGNTSEYRLGDRNLLDVEVVGIQSDALRWALRNQRDVSFSEALSSSDASSIIITDNSVKDLKLTMPYAGQGLVMQDAPAWSLMLSSEWLRWSFFRSAPTDQKQIILWVRGDLFPGANIIKREGS